jgi:hypothetical protein
MLAGQAVRDSRWALEQVAGALTVARALESLPPAVREEYESATPLSWVPYETVRAFHDALGREAKEPIERLLERAIPLAMERSFSTVWRVFLRFTTDDALLARAPLIYSRSRNRGKMTARTTGPGEALAEVTGWASIPPRDVLALAVSIRSFLMLAGRKEVTADGSKTATGARWIVRWRV